MTTSKLQPGIDSLFKSHLNECPYKQYVSSENGTEQK